MTFADSAEACSIGDKHPSLFHTMASDKEEKVFYKIELSGGDLIKASTAAATKPLLT